MPLPSQDVFIPPDGAMQFEFMTARCGRNERFLGTAIWIEGKPFKRTVHGPLCKCKRFRVIHPVFDVSVKGRAPLVCACNGRIIE